MSRGADWPSIDHSLLSPSGKMSKRARKAAMERENRILFPPGYWDAPAKTPAEIRQAQHDSLILAASNLRTLAGRGMNTRKYEREAARLEAEAAALID